MFFISLDMLKLHISKYSNVFFLCLFIVKRIHHLITYRLRTSFPKTVQLNAWSMYINQRVLKNLLI